MTDFNFKPSRRGFLGLAGGAAALGAFGRAANAQAMVQTKAKIVIVGSGAAGTGLVNRLVQRLEGAQITLIDGRKDHYYQPGFTLIAAGLKPADYSVSGTGDWLPSGVTWIEDYAAAIDPEAQRITTQGGEAVDYDYLVVATGLKLDWDAVEGFSLDQVGENGIGAVYAGPEYAARTWKAMDQFTDKGGVALFGRPATEMKCAGAPLKYTFLTDDYLRRKGTRENAQVIYTAHNATLFSVPVVDEKVKLLFGEHDFDTRYNHILTGIDTATREAYYRVPESKKINPDNTVSVTPERVEKITYDFTNVIPPQRAPDVVRESGLAWADKWIGQDWLEVDQETLRHHRYPNVFGIGDIAGVPKGKTAASVKWQIPVVEDHLVAAVQGREGSAIYNGYTSCPLITKVGRAMLVEFDYENRLTPSFPGVISPLEELWISWLMKEVALKPTYNAMLRGKA